MKVEAEIPSLKKVSLEVNEKITVDQLKRTLCKKLGLEPRLTSIIQGGNHVPGEVKLKSLQDKKFQIDYFWARQALIFGLKGQKQLRKAKVFLAGAGSLGNENAKNLALMGVGHLTIADYDKIETSNLSRCIFFEKGDVGAYKAETLREKLKRNYPYTKCKAYNKRTEEVPDEEYLTSDIIISGVDNLTTRIFLTTVSNRYRIPLIDGGMIGNQCRVQNFIPGETACPICIVPPLNYGQLTGLRDPCSAPIEEGATPSLMTTTSLVSTLQSSEAVKLILRRVKSGKKLGEPIEGVLVIDLQYNRFSNLPLKKNTNCFVCGSKGIANEPVTLIEVKLEGQRPSFKKMINEIKGKLGIKETPILYSKRNGSYLNLVKDEDIKKTRINTGDYIHVIFNKGKRYKEAVIKLL